MINPASPLFVDVLLYTVYALLLAAVALVLWSCVRSIRLRNRSEAVENRIPARRLAWGVALMFVLLLAFTFATGSTEPIYINGKPFTNTLWLRVSDMLINSSLALIAIATLCAAWGGRGKMKN